MKLRFTFSELSKIFSTIAKIDVLAQEQIRAAKEYDNKGRIFDAEFEKYGYTFIGAPQELRDLFEEKTNSLRELQKAERKAYKGIKEVAELLGVGIDDKIWEEDDVIYFIKTKWGSRIERIAERCKFLAIIASKRVVY